MRSYIRIAWSIVLAGIAFQTEGSDASIRARREHAVDEMSRAGQLETGIAEEARRLLDPKGEKNDAEGELRQFVEELADGRLLPGTYAYLRQLILERHYNRALAESRTSAGRSDHYSAMKHAERALALPVSDRSGATEALCRALVGEAQKLQRQGRCQKATELLDKADRLRVSGSTRSRISKVRAAVMGEMENYNSCVSQARALVDEGKAQDAHELLCKAIEAKIDDKSMAREMLPMVAQAAYEKLLRQAKEAIQNQQFHPDARRLLNKAATVRGANTSEAEALLRELPAEAGSARWHTFESAFDKARKEPKIILIDFYAPWCAWCKRMEDTFMDDTVAAKLKSFITARVYDRERRDLVKKYRIRGFPCILFLDAEGTILRVVSGHRRPNDFVTELDRVVSVPTELPAAKMALAQDPSDIDANLWMAAHWASTKMTTDAVRYKKAALGALADKLDRDQNPSILTQVLPRFSELVQRRAAKWPELMVLVARLKTAEARSQFLALFATQAGTDSTMHKELGKQYERNRMVAKALEAYDRAIEVLKKRLQASKRHPVLMAQLGRCHYLKGDYAKAELLTQNALKRYSKLRDARRTLALIRLAQHKAKSAIREYGQAFSGKPTSTAVQEVEELLARKPDVPEAHFAMAYLHEKRGDTAAALRSYRDYVAAVKTGKLADQARSRLGPAFCKGLRALCSSDPEGRRKAAAELVGICGQAPALSEKLLASKSTARAVGIVLACAVSPESAEAVLSALRSGQADPLRVALRDLLTGKTSWWTRAGAAVGLGELAAPGCSDALIKGIADEHPAVRREAARSLGRMQGKAAAEALLGALKDTDDDVRAAAADSLGAMRETTAGPALKALLEDESVEVRAAAAGALLRMGEPQGYQALAVLGKSTSSRTRSAADNAWAKARAKEQEAFEILKVLRTRDAKVAEDAADGFASHLISAVSPLSRTRKYDEATGLCELAVRLSPDGLRYDWLGYLHSKQNQLEASIEAYQKALDLGRSSESLHSNIALVYKKLGNVDKAMAHYRERIELGGDEAKVALPQKELARLCVAKGDYAQGLALYEHVRRVLPTDTDVALEYAWGLFRAGRLDDAKAAAQALLQLSRSVPACRLLLGLISLEQGQRADGLTNIRASAESLTQGGAPSDPIGCEQAVAVGLDWQPILQRLQTTDRALATELSRVVAKALGRRANTWANSGWKQSPLDLCRAAAALCPDDAEIQERAGLTFTKLDRLDEASQALARAVKAAPDSARIHGNYGWVLYLQGNYDQARVHTDRALELDSSLAFVQGNAALLCVREDNLKDAIPHYTRVVGIGRERHVQAVIDDLNDLAGRRPDLAAADYAIAYCYDKRGHIASARRHYEAYLERAKQGECPDAARARLTDWVALPSPAQVAK